MRGANVMAFPLTKQTHAGPGLIGEFRQLPQRVGPKQLATCSFAVAEAVSAAFKRSPKAILPMKPKQFRTGRLVPHGLSLHRRLREARIC